MICNMMKIHYLVRIITDVTDDGQDGKDHKGKYCVISAMFSVGIFTGN